VRVNAQLVAADTGSHLWADRFDAPRRGVLEAQDEIVGRLSRAVGLRMVDAEARRAEQAEHAHPGEATAQDYVLRARAAASRRMMAREGVEAARALYALALECDHENADALAGVACMRVHQVVQGHLAAERTALGEAGAAREASLAEAEDELARALAAAPGHLGALKGRAMLLRARGLFADAIAAAEAVLARNPGEPAAHREIGLSLLHLGQAEEAVAAFRRADALASGDDPARWTWLQGLGRALIHLGRDAEAADALRLAAASNPGFAPSHALLAAALALAGEDAPARAALAEFRHAEPGTAVEALARRSAVPSEAAHPLYRSRDGRVLDGLRRAAGLAAAA
jgi:tetratricopeptide (TPR) repeat protein